MLKKKKEQLIIIEKSSTLGKIMILKIMNLSVYKLWARGSIWSLINLLIIQLTLLASLEKSVVLMLLQVEKRGSHFSTARVWEVL